jgi:hypothetical protein
MSADLGGDQNISEAERAIIRRAAVIITELERMEKNFARSDGAPGILTRLLDAAILCFREFLGLGFLFLAISLATGGESSW